MSMYLHLPEDINSVCLYTNPWKLRLLIGKLFTKNMYALYISNIFLDPGGTGSTGHVI